MNPRWHPLGAHVAAATPRRYRRPTRLLVPVLVDLVLLAALAAVIWRWPV